MAKAPAKVTGLSTAKPAAPAPVVTEKGRFVPTKPKDNAGNIEYAPEKVDEVLANFMKIAETAELKPKASKTPKVKKNIARNIVVKLMPAIKILMEKNYSRKEIHEHFTAQGIKINYTGFSSAINKQLKLEEAAAEAKRIEIELAGQSPEGEAESLHEDTSPLSDEELAEAEKNAKEATDLQNV